MEGKKPTAEYIQFVNGMDQIMIIAAIVALVLAIVLFILHKGKVNMIKSLKGKYDYIRLNQIKNYQFVYFAIAGAIFFFGNTLGTEFIAKSLIYIFVRLFISLCVAVLFGYVIFLILKFYYPAKMEKHLRRLRYAPRYSKDGNEMKLLSEDEEDVHLDEGMQAEENVFSVDYDVWVDNSSGEVHIEKYSGYLEALECGSCGFQTLTLQSEEIIKTATETEEGELIKHHKCTYCNAQRHTRLPIAKILTKMNEYTLPEDYVLKGERKVKSLMIEIISTKGDKTEYFFQSTHQAKDFLEQFEFDKENEIMS
jgi:phosphate/sulfate permease